MINFRIALATAAVLLAGALGALLPAGALANHAVGQLSSPTGDPATGETLVDGDWSFTANFPAGPAAEQPIGVDVERFTRRQADGVHHYLIASSMTIGFSIFDVTNPDAPVRVADYGAAVCGVEAQVQQVIDIIAHGGDFDEGSTALGAVHGWEDDIQVTPDGRIAVLASDAAGRCHDPASGGMEIVDISNPAQPSLLGLVRLQGESHNTTIDRKRPWIVYNSNSDSDGNNFIEAVDISSCRKLNPSRCLPSVSRLQFRDRWTVGTQSEAPSACHDLEYSRNRLYGACLNTTIVFDVSKVWRHGHLTGTDLTDPGQVGDAACSREAPSPEAMVNLRVVDCRGWTVHAWKAAKARNVRIRKLLRIRHAGVDFDEDAPPREDIQISHQAMPLAHGRLMIVSDERGGGLNAAPGDCPSGGLWFYDIRHPRHPKLARTPHGRRAVFLPTANDTVETNGSNCTAHVFHRVPGERRMLSEAWYSSGTQAFRYRARFRRRRAIVSFRDRRAYVPSGASTWTSRAYANERQPDGSHLLRFFATDISRGFDFFTLRLPR